MAERRKQALICVMGDVGVGKTLVLRKIRQVLEQEFGAGVFVHEDEAKSDQAIQDWEREVVKSTWWHLAEKTNDPLEKLAVADLACANSLPNPIDTRPALKGQALLSELSRLIAIDPGLERSLSRWVSVLTRAQDKTLGQTPKFKQCRIQDLDGFELRLALAHVLGLSAEIHPPEYGTGWRIKLISDREFWRPDTDWQHYGDLLEMDKIDKKVIVELFRHEISTNRLWTNRLGTLRRLVHMLNGDKRTIELVDMDQYLGSEVDRFEYIDGQLFSARKSSPKDHA
ncbi:hypothetical protein ACLPJK_26525 [Pseudomonas aeruginosa]|uniref:hypothetical protein n=1 Tax=Pseudomonas aeruginosa TaxID=287 RepID=UPI003D2BFA9B